MSWYQRWFADELYLELYSHRDAGEARQVVDLFLKETAVPERATILDLACGTGRHAFEFARRGHHVVAADLSATLLAVAQRKTQRYSGLLSLVRADMRRIPFQGCFDAVAQLFTAFGYFPSDEENAAVIDGVARALRPGGRYMLDFLNAAEVIAGLRPFSEDEVPGGRARQERRIENGRIVKDITIEQDGQRKQFQESVRLFTRGELEGLFARNGFRVDAVFGSYSGDAFRDNSPRCILLATKLP